MSYIREYAPKASQIPLGSMLKQVQLAEGKVDIYASIEIPLKLWDTAAGHAIVVGPGGYMTQPDGTALNYSNPNFRIGSFVARATAGSS